MMTGRGKLGDLPVMGSARERLRQAQRREADAVAATLMAARRLEAAEHKLAMAVQAHEPRIAAARSRLHDAQVAVVEVSGIERAAALLAVSVSELRARQRDVVQRRT